MVKINLTCTLCETEEVELYYCETCSIPKLGNQSSQQKQLLCEPCLGPHVRRCHQVTTSKGQELLICTQHRRLHNQYCKSCDESFCPKCLENHSGHFMGSIDERAAEIRKEVFSMLTTLERNEKPLQAKKEEICALKLKHQIDQKNLKEFVENEIEKLRQLLHSRIAENEAEMESEEKTIEQEIDEVLDLQNKSRTLLSSTNPHLVNKFKDVKLSFEKACNSFEKTMLIKISVKSSNLQVLGGIFDEVGPTVHDKLRSDFETEKLEIVEHALLNGKDGSRFCLIIEDGEINIFSVKVPEGQQPTLEKMGKIHLNFIGPIKSCYSVFSNSHKCSCVVLTHARIAFRIDVTENDNLELNEILFPPFANLISAYTIPENSGEIYWCYWSAEQKVLKLSHEPLFEEKCPSKPSLVSLDIDGHGLCYKGEGGTIFIVDPEKTKVVFILPNSREYESHVILYHGSLVYIGEKQSDCYQSYSTIGHQRMRPRSKTTSNQRNFVDIKIGVDRRVRFFPLLKLQYNQTYYQFNHVVLFLD